MSNSLKRKELNCIDLKAFNITLHRTVYGGVSQNTVPLWKNEIELWIEPVNLNAVRNAVTKFLIRVCQDCSKRKASTYASSGVETLYH